MSFKRLGAALAELARRRWGLFKLGHWRGSDRLAPVAGGQWLAHSTGCAQTGRPACPRADRAAG